MEITLSSGGEQTKTEMIKTWLRFTLTPFGQRSQSKYQSKTSVFLWEVRLLLIYSNSFKNA